jgi:DNA polymerase IV
MQKVDENGALCLKEWQPEMTTHIVVDSCLTYADVLKVLKIKAVPDHIIVVKDNYPSDCLHYRRILDHTQFMYEVAGQGIPPPPPVGPSPYETPQSLQIKAKENAMQENSRR